MPSVADDLANVLFALRSRALTTSAVTAQITTAIVQWAVAHGWYPRTEARVQISHKGDEAALGFMDVVVRRGGGVPDLAIEIDSTDKPWSVTKLRHAAAGGMHAIWVRWGDDEWAGIHEDLDVIQLRVLRRPAKADSAVSQIGLWSGD